MQASEVHDYASRLLKLHGDEAQVIAARRALECDKSGDRQETENWRRYVSLVNVILRTTA